MVRFRNTVLMIFAALLLAPLSSGQTMPDTEGPREEYEATPPPVVDVRSSVGEEPIGNADAKTAEPDTYMKKVHQNLDKEDVETVGSGTDPDSLRPSYHLSAYNLLKTVMYLLLVIAMILLVYYFLRKRLRGGHIISPANLGAVIGRLYLAPKTCLHFVNTNGRVLIVGESSGGLVLIADFDEADFDALEQEQPAETGKSKALKKQAGGGTEFLTQLRDSLKKMNKPEVQESESESPSTDDIASLKGEIQKLQDYLRDSTRETGE